MTHKTLPGRDFPLGAHWDGTGVNFALFSANATKVELCLFDRAGRRELERRELPEQTHEVWHGHFDDIRPGQLYGYRVHGPYEPQVGHRFNPNKLLIDPYARQLQGKLTWHDALYGYKIGSKRADLSFDRRDSARYIPKCVVAPEGHSYGKLRKPQTPWSETVTYEAHVRGMTMAHEKLPERIRGTFEGLAHPSTIERLASLGVTAVQLMPIHSFFDDRFLVEKGLRNYWGYSTLNFFAPAPRYLTENGDLSEFRVMVRRLHEAGIEVILDVVYNHTAEGAEGGPTLCYRGIDNASYYQLGDDPRFNWDVTGTGNTLDLRNSRVLQMVMDSLRYWVTEMGVDGFRFDLASTLARDRDRFDPRAPFLEAIAQDPVLQGVKLIAEPWDVGPDGYQVGGFPPGWAEFNDQYRDTMRGYWKGDEGLMPGVSHGFLGSAGIFEKRGRKPWASINFITAHDGFTLMDTVSYNDKHNEENGEENCDGHGHNLSWNHGAEGETEDEETLEARDRTRRNLMGTMLLSQGTPMILMGDEIGRTQGGNNNSYAQDRDYNYLKWDGVSERDAAFEAFTRDLIALRKAHPLLAVDQFIHAEPYGTTEETARWIAPEGGDVPEGVWQDPQTRCVGLWLAGPKAEALILLNADVMERPFALPEGAPWGIAVDTFQGKVTPKPKVDLEGEAVLPGRSLTMLVR